MQIESTAEESFGWLLHFVESQECAWSEPQSVIRHNLTSARSCFLRSGGRAKWRISN